MSHRLRLLLIGALLSLIVVLLVGPRLALRRATVERFLASYFASTTSIESFDVSLWPTASASATGVLLRRDETAGLPPVVTIEEVHISAGVFGLLRSPRHLSQVHVEGLTIRIPPRAKVRQEPAGDAGERGDRTPLVVDRVIADEARLELLRDEPGKPPVAFDLRHLDARSVATDRPLTFDTQLVNPKPRGLISATGSFGPWNASEAGQTPVSGNFTYRDADLGTIGGLGGKLSAEGTFQGPLRGIAVRGRTDTPDFSLDLAGRPVPLTTTFEARVDGTNGNTYLDRVEARLVETTIVAKGAIEDEPNPSSRAVNLQVVIDQGRIEDVMRLALSSEPPLSGDLHLTTRLHLPGERRDVIEKLELDGDFTVSRAVFASEAAREKIGEMSARARGNPDEEGEAPVATDFAGRFRLKDGTLRFSELRFAIPGATVRLAGTYTLRGEKLDMRGTLRMDAKISETTSGWKSVLLKIVDPLFSKGKKGSVVPIKLTGTARKPEFGLDAAKTFGGD